MRESEHVRESERERVAGWGANSWVSCCEVSWRIAVASCTVRASLGFTCYVSVGNWACQ